MNCKPGDLAVIVLPGTTDRNLGKFVQVIKPSRMGIGWWYVEGLSPAYMDQGNIGTIGHIEDCRLRPIRPQDDDATDETLLWLPVPSPKEHA